MCPETRLQAIYPSTMPGFEFVDALKCNANNVLWLIFGTFARLLHPRPVIYSWRLLHINVPLAT